MSEKIYCKDCRFCEYGKCRLNPPVWIAGYSGSLFPIVKDFDWCGMAEKKEDDSCNSESPEYQHQVKIKTLEDKIEFHKDTQTKGNATAGYKPEKSELKPINPPKRK